MDKPEELRDGQQDPPRLPGRHHRLENQAEPSQIPVHPDVLLRSQQFQVPPPSPPVPTQQPGHPQTSTHPIPRRHRPPRHQRNHSRTHPWVRSENPVRHSNTLYPARFHQNSACERMIRRIFRMPDRFPSNNLDQETNTIQIQSRFKQLQSRYVSRTQHLFINHNEEDLQNRLHEAF
jgi:hypothetical protein